MLVANETDLLKSKGLRKLMDFIGWCKKFNVEELTVCVGVVTKSGELIDHIVREMVGISAHGKLKIIYPGNEVETGNNGFKINVVIGLGGKEELIHAVRKMMCDIRVGRLDPEKITEETVGEYLKIHSQPDLIIKAGKRLSDFLIWQSIYSELYFIDVSWVDMRYIDFLRCLRDYQRRERRYGR
jgi:undecaprenyl diphosphate synthase